MNEGQEDPPPQHNAGRQPSVVPFEIEEPPDPPQRVEDAERLPSARASRLISALGRGARDAAAPEVAVQPPSDAGSRHARNGRRNEARSRGEDRRSLRGEPPLSPRDARGSKRRSHRIDDLPVENLLPLERQSPRRRRQSHRVDDLEREGLIEPEPRSSQHRRRSHRVDDPERGGLIEPEPSSRRRHREYGRDGDEDRRGPDATRKGKGKAPDRDDRDPERRRSGGHRRRADEDERRDKHRRKPDDDQRHQRRSRQDKASNEAVEENVPDSDVAESIAWQSDGHPQFGLETEGEPPHENEAAEAERQEDGGEGQNVEERGDQPSVSHSPPNRRRKKHRRHRRSGGHEDDRRSEHGSERRRASDRRHSNVEYLEAAPVQHIRRSVHGRQGEPHVVYVEDRWFPVNRIGEIFFPKRRPWR